MDKKSNKISPLSSYKGVPSGVTAEDFGEGVEIIKDNDLYPLNIDHVMECPGNTFMEKLDNYTIHLFQEGNEGMRERELEKQEERNDE